MKIYMNNAATSFPKPEVVAKAVYDDILTLPGAANRGGVETFSVFDQTRQLLAELMELSNPNDIALGSNASWGLNLALLGFPFNPGDIVVTTTAEHNSILRPLHRLEQNGLVNVITIPVDDKGRIDADEWRAAFTAQKVRLAVFTHASNVTGAVNDAADLTAIAKAYGATVLLDASQSLGLVPCTPEVWGVDMLAFTGHKYLLGPQGTGGLWVHPELELTPYLVGGTGVYSDSPDMPPEMPLHLEAGTGNESSFSGLAAALIWSRENPLDTRSFNDFMMTFREGLAAAGAQVIAPDGLCTPVISFIIDGMSCEDVGFVLTDSYDIICRTGLHCAPLIHKNLRYNNNGTVRLSLSRFTTIEEAEIAVSAVRDLIDGGLF